MAIQAVAGNLAAQKGWALLLTASDALSAVTRTESAAAAAMAGAAALHPHGEWSKEEREELQRLSDAGLTLVTLGVLDLALSILLMLGVVSLYPLVRFRAMLPDGEARGYVAENHGALDGVLELPHVAWPRMRLDRIHGVRQQRGRGSAVLGSEAAHGVDERRWIAEAEPARRQIVFTGRVRQRGAHR